jgi:hypothetical protein
VAKGGDWTPAVEMARGDLKTSRTGSRTPFQILVDYYQTGDTRDRELWREYGRITRSLAAVRWSRGLRAIMVGPAARPAKTDAELAAEQVTGVLVITIELAAWLRIRLAGLEQAILVAAERDGRGGIGALMKQQ